MGALFFFTLRMKNQHTNDADSHAKRHKTMVAHTQADTSRYKYISPTTHTQMTTHLTKLYAKTFFSKAISGEYSALLPTHLEFVVIRARCEDYI